MLLIPKAYPNKMTQTQVSVNSGFTVLSLLKDSLSKLFDNLRISCLTEFGSVNRCLDDSATIGTSAF